MRITDFKKLVELSECPNCYSNDPSKFIVITVLEDSIVLKCQDCSCRFKLTYKTEILCKGE